MERDEKALWNQKYSEHSHASLEPDPFLVSAYAEFLTGSPPGVAVDVAGGVGRHSLWLAERGWKVKLVDVSEVGIELARKNIAAQSNYSSRVHAEVVDLQIKSNLGEEKYDLVLV